MARWGEGFTAGASRIKRPRNPRGRTKCREPPRKRLREDPKPQGVSRVYTCIMGAFVLWAGRMQRLLVGPQVPLWGSSPCACKHLLLVTRDPLSW